MAKSGNPANFRQGVFNTLAQNGTTDNGKLAKILVGTGSDITTPGYGKKKTKKKAIAQALALRLIDIAKKEGRNDLIKQFWNTYYCQNKVYTYGKHLYGNYCKNRTCPTCLGNRKAMLIQTYYPILKEWKDAHFVTLTVKARPKYMLNKLVIKLIEGFSRIIDKYEKRASRGTGTKLIGIRSLECNFSPDARTYNPHFHILVPDQETGEILIKEWLLLWKPTNVVWTNRKAQDIQKVYNLDTALFEIIKYGTKVFTDLADSRKVKTDAKLYARAFYNIIVAMHGHRLFSSFGFKLPKAAKAERPPAKLVTDYTEWVHLNEYNDWQDTESEQTLFGCIPNNVLKELLETSIDMDKD